MWLRAFLILAVLLVGSVEARLASNHAPAGRQVQQELLTPDQVLALMNSGQLAKAERAARVAMKARPDSARSRLLLARILARQGDLVQARALLKQARALPQWTQQKLGVPYPTPDQLDTLVRTEPAKALDVLADVLLALGDDPKAYFLQARAYGELGQWDRGRAALQRARALNPSLAFADPGVLSALEQALADEIAVEKPDTSLSDVTFGSDGNAVVAQVTPWWQRPWVWLTVGLLSGLAGWFAVSLARWKRQRELEVRQTIAPMTLQLTQEIQATQNQLFMREDAELRRKLGRLLNLQGDVNMWAAQPLHYEPNNIGPLFQRLWHASLSDVNYAAYQQEEAMKAQQAAELAARKAAERAQRQAEDEARRAAMPSRSESSFSSDSGSSWSGGSSSSSTDNSGGKDW